VSLSVRIRDSPGATRECAVLIRCHGSGAHDAFCWSCVALFSCRFFFRFVSPRLVFFYSTHSAPSHFVRFGESRLFRWLTHLSLSPIYQARTFLFLSQDIMAVERAFHCRVAYLFKLTSRGCRTMMRPRPFSPAAIVRATVGRKKMSRSWVNAGKEERPKRTLRSSKFSLAVCTFLCICHESVHFGKCSYRTRLRNP